MSLLPIDKGGTASMPSDAILIRSGDWNNLFLKHLRTIESRVKYYQKKFPAYADLLTVGEVFARLIEQARRTRFQSFKPRFAFEHYLFRIVSNICIAIINEGRERIEKEDITDNEVLQQFIDEQFTEQEEEKKDEEDKGNLSLLSEHDQLWILISVVNAIYKLDPRNKTVLLRYYFFDIKDDDTAHHFDVVRETIVRWKREARELLRDSLQGLFFRYSSRFSTPGQEEIGDLLKYLNKSNTALSQRFRDLLSQEAHLLSPLEQQVVILSFFHQAPGHQLVEDFGLDSTNELRSIISRGINKLALRFSLSQEEMKTMLDHEGLNARREVDRDQLLS